MDTAETPEPATYTVVTLGPSGAGKTVYLSTLWEVLRTQHRELAFHLGLGDRFQADKLTSVFREVASPADNWPLPTDGLAIPEWTFSFRVSSPNGQFEPMRVRYVDYAGERLTHPQAGSSEQERLEETLRNADAFLGLLDGRKVLDLMRGDSRFLALDLPHVLGVMQNCRGPIHFIITKWDLLAEYYSLKQIKDRLLEHPGFNGLVDSRKSWNSGKTPVPPGRVRLIPVSSVGIGFAFLDSEGRMHKRENAQPRPFNVEVSFAAVLPDLLAYAHKAMADERKQGQFLTRQVIIQSAATALQGIANFISSRLSIPIVQVPATLFSAFTVVDPDRADVRELPRKERRRARRLQRSIRNRKFKAVKDDISAAHFILHRMVDVLQKFEESPENDGSTLS